MDSCTFSTDEVSTSTQIDSIEAQFQCKHEDQDWCTDTISSFGSVLTTLSKSCSLNKENQQEEQNKLYKTLHETEFKCSFVVHPKLSHNPSLLGYDGHSSQIALIFKRLDAALTLFDQVIPSSLKHNFHEIKNIVEKCAELGVKEIAGTLGNMTTELLNCSDAYDCAIRSLFSWSELTKSTLEVFIATIKNTPCINSDILPASVFENGLETMQRVVKALIDCHGRLRCILKQAESLLRGLGLVRDPVPGLTNSSHGGDADQFEIIDPNSQNNDAIDKFELMDTNSQKTDAIDNGSCAPDNMELVLQIKVDDIGSLEAALTSLPGMIQSMIHHIETGLSSLSHLKLHECLRSGEWDCEHLDEKLHKILVESSEKLIATCEQFQVNHGNRRGNILNSFDE